jgi:hypothetical protein
MVVVHDTSKLEYVPGCIAAIDGDVVELIESIEWVIVVTRSTRL